jgi:hypothetical protein
MAFDRAYLTRVGGSANQQLWTYYTNDTQAAVKTQDYFLDMIDDFNVNDIIIVLSDMDGTAAVSYMFVTNVTTTVNVSDNMTVT